MRGDMRYNTAMHGLQLQSEQKNVSEPLRDGYDIIVWLGIWTYYIAMYFSIKETYL